MIPFLLLLLFLSLSIPLRIFMPYTSILRIEGICFRPVFRNNFLWKGKNLFKICQLASSQIVWQLLSMTNNYGWNLIEIMNPWNPHTVTKTILCSSVPYGRSILTVIDLSFAIVLYFLKISIAVVCVFYYIL